MILFLKVMSLVLLICIIYLIVDMACNDAGIDLDEKIVEVMYEIIGSFK